MHTFKVLLVQTKSECLIILARHVFYDNFCVLFCWSFECHNPTGLLAQQDLRNKEVHINFYIQDHSRHARSLFDTGSALTTAANGNVQNLRFDR